jgi:hypothetical protein
VVVNDQRLWGLDHARMGSGCLPRSQLPSVAGGQFIAAQYLLARGAGALVGANPARYRRESRMERCRGKRGMESEITGLAAMTPFTTIPPTSK